MVYLRVLLFYFSFTMSAFAVDCTRAASGDYSILELPSYENFSSSHKGVDARIEKLKFKKKKPSWKHNSSDPLVEVLGKGYRAIIVKTEKGRVFKIAREDSEDAYKLYLEVLINTHLAENLSHYNIYVDEIIGVDPHYAFLEKIELDQNYIASEIAQKTKGLSKKQIKELKKVFKSGVLYAEEQGIGLDLKASNLYWNGKNWVLFDSGPRTSYLPFGYTSDLSSFSQYLEVWLKEEPELD